MWLGTSATALLQIKDNIDTNTTYTLTKSGSTIQLKNQAGAIVSSITDANTTYGNASQDAAGLMSADDKKKLDGIAAGANNITVDSALSNTSTNPVQNKVVNAALAEKAASSHNHDSSYVKKVGDTMSGPLKISGTAASQPLVVRGIVGQDGSGAVDELYLQYGADKALKLGNDGSYSISADGGTYSGKAATAGVADSAKAVAWGNITSKPSFATVSTSGSYNDLSNKPTIPTVPNAIKNPNALTISLNGNSQGTYDGSAAKAINVTAASIGAAASSHAHSATDITSGTLDVARIPNVNDKVTAVAASKITGTIDASHLPSYVDDVIEGYLSSGKLYKTKSSDGTYATEIAGEAGKIYTDLNTNKIYRWSGSTFVVVSDTIALGETSSTAYRGDRGAAAYSHISRTDNPHNVTKAQVGLGNVENKSSATIRGELTKDNVTTALGYTPPTADTNTWQANTVSQNGYVTAPTTSNANKVWKTDASGVPGWRADDNTWRGIQNNLTSTATDQSLSAAQGKILNDKFASYVPTSRTVNGKALTSNISLSYSDVGAAASSHSHDYLPLSGGTMTGIIVGKSSQGTWIDARNNACLTNAAGANGSYNPILSQKTANGEWSIGNLSGQETLTVSYTTNTNYSAGTNTSTAIQFPVATGTVALTSQIPSVGNGTVTIKQAGTSKGTFTMNQSGNTTIELTDNNTTYSAATASAAGLMSAADKSKLDGIADGANKYTYTLPTASSSTLGGVKTGNNITNSSGTISISKTNVETALGYTINASVPSEAKFTDTNTWRGIQNSLTSTSTTDSLAAAQGKALKDQLDNTIVISSTQPSSSACKIWVKI